MDNLVVRPENGASLEIDILSYLAARRCRSLQKICGGTVIYGPL
jgi:hypothetical protein